MFTTIKSQVSIALTLLMLLLIVQLLLSNENQDSYLASINNTQSVVATVNIVGELEKDVIDLQRNVLIYKETASKSVESKFVQLMKHLSENLDVLQARVQKKANVENYTKIIDRMRSHLKDYELNFSEVVKGRAKRDLLLEQQVFYNFDRMMELAQSQQHLTNEPTKSAIKYTSNNSLSFELALVQSYGLRYILTYNSNDLDKFNNQLNYAQDYMQKVKLSVNLASQITEITNELRLSYEHLNQTTRGYIYLVNVVMAGSANEFLYLTKTLNQLVSKDLIEINHQVLDTLDNATNRNNLFASIGLLLAVVMAFFLLYRVILPIRHITNIFKQLAKGNDVEKITDIARQDEIGQLSKAAEIFHFKNQQTQSLLAESHQLNEEQNNLNEQLTHSIKEAEAATKSKSLFLANMSHEIRTPMNGIIGLVDHLLQGELTQEQLDDLQKVSYSTQILMGVINDILDFSKIEAGKLAIENEVFDINNVFETLLSNIKLLAKEKNLTLNFFADPNLPVALIGDSLRLSQVLFNLCTNAIKFTPDGVVGLDFTFEEINNKKLKLIVKVSDTGIGMSPPQVDKIFEAFSQADDSTSRKYGGTGLGLSIVNHLVNLMGGEISCDSKENIGTCFTVSFLLGFNNVEQTIIAENKTHRSKIHYFGYLNHPLIPTKYLETTKVPTEFFNIKALAHYDHSEINENELTVIDMHSADDFSLIDSKLEQLLTLNHDVLICTDSPKILKSISLPSSDRLMTMILPESPKRIIELLSSGHSIERASRPSVSVEKQYQGHILLIEDNAINRLVAGKLLSSLGLTFDFAENGKLGVEMYEKNTHYDLLLMDVQMPVMDGYEATELLRSKGHDVAICGLSANAMKADSDRGHEAGMNAYITKPIKKKSLTAVFDKLLPPQLN